MKKTLVISMAILGGAMLSVKAADANALWAKDCAMCHGKDGKGDTKIGQKLGVKDFTDPKVQAEMKDDAVTKAIKEGVKTSNGRLKMKAFPNLSDDEVEALVQYVRGFKK